MQDFYGEDPFVLNKDVERTIKNKQTINVGINKRSVAIVTIVSLIVIFVAAFCGFEKSYAVVVPAKTYYAVRFYSGQVKSEAESISADLISSGGSGYIANDGIYNVYGGVYKDKDAAESVAKKQTLEVKVVCVGWPEYKIGATSSGGCKRCGDALMYFSEVVDDLVNMSVNLDTFVESETTIKAYVTKTIEKFRKYRDSLENEQIRNFFDRCAFSAQTNIIEKSEDSFNSRLKYVVHDLIMLRVNLDNENS